MSIITALFPRRDYLITDICNLGAHITDIPECLELLFPENIIEGHLFIMKRSKILAEPLNFGLQSIEATFQSIEAFLKRRYARFEFWRE